LFVWIDAVLAEAEICRIELRDLRVDMHEYTDKLLSNYNVNSFSRSHSVHQSSKQPHIEIATISWQRRSSSSFRRNYSGNFVKLGELRQEFDFCDFAAKPTDERHHRTCSIVTTACQGLGLVLYLDLRAR